MGSRIWFIWVGLGLVAATAGGCAESDDCALTATCPYEWQAEADAADEAQATGSCVDDADCGGGACVDGYCCDSRCDGLCERCDVAGREGTCSAIAAGTDPDGECSGGASAECSGSCDGNRGCSFPGDDRACGGESCTDGVHSGSFCDGEGQCVERDTPCGLYACDETSCLTQCQTSADCVAGAYCDEGKCVEQRDVGEVCATKEACKSDLCEGGFCCSTECGEPASCATGTCLCGGVVCNTDVECIVWQMDRDGDGFPASSEKDIVGCANRRPAEVAGRKYYNPSTVLADCDDDDANVFPGQTKYFTTPRKNGGGFDYDCDGTITRKHPRAPLGYQCRACMPEPPFCKAGLNPALFLCGPGAVVSTINDVYETDVECGDKGDLVSCEVTDGIACSQVVTKRVSTSQACR